MEKRERIKKSKVNTVGGVNVPQRLADIRDSSNFPVLLASEFLGVASSPQDGDVVAALGSLSNSLGVCPA
jgi:hypothetical protein